MKCPSVTLGNCRVRTPFSEDASIQCAEFFPRAHRTCDISKDISNQRLDNLYSPYEVCFNESEEKVKSSNYAGRERGSVLCPKRGDPFKECLPEGRARGAFPKDRCG